MAVSRQSAHSFAPDEILGVAIGTPNPDNTRQRHVGLIYRIDDSDPRFCRLAWHFMLEDEPLPTDYFWGSSGLDPANKVFMAAYVASFDQNASDVPYGINYNIPLDFSAARALAQEILHDMYGSSPIQ